VLLCEALCNLKVKKLKKITPYSSSHILIGSVPLGGDYPIRIQSMTNTDTLDTKASVAQCIRIIEAGADFVRLTTQGTREAENLANIKNELRKAGYNTPLIADVHFNPAAAETAARIVEKVRINPGNYTDKRASFQSVDLTEEEYNEELERIHERLLPLLNICRENKTVIRIGINHGSLSDRIMTRYGNTPVGMVQSAMEFINIFRSENFSNLVLSMKSSDTSVMIEATRMLVKRMQESSLSYPLHLGVTEAGEGEDGRIRSAAGIGALLAEGIGDTIRVSLSEDPEKEIPVAMKLAGFYPRGISTAVPSVKIEYKTPSHRPMMFAGVHGPLVFADLRGEQLNDHIWKKAGYEYSGGNIKKADGSADVVLLNDSPILIPKEVNIALPLSEWKGGSNNSFPVIKAGDREVNSSRKLNIILVHPGENIEDLRETDPGIDLILLRFSPYSGLFAPREFMTELYERNIACNLVLNPVFREDQKEDLQIKAAALLGQYLNDNMITGICITNEGSIEIEELTKISFGILQCTGKRITRTMYLSCPTCGRTKFNLQEAVQKVKAATGHLKGLKIAVMGCIVNGPGEMAGADYGYVGAAPGKVHIYKGTVPVLKNVPEGEAVEKLLEIIGLDQKVK
jgi:(E)-4-hydroxy-3-methylbut-2-enyl-diphosphate synthase